VGPTASGKSQLAIKVARHFNGEVISADSRSIYKGLSVGTAKPTRSEQKGIKHYGFDIVEPDEAFSAAAFQELAKHWISDIQGRGKLPIVCGGTGLYVDGLLFNYQFGKKADLQRRKELESYSTEQLWDYCKEHNIVLPENYKNKRYVIRAIEQSGINTAKSDQLAYKAIVVGIAPEKAELRERIEKRTERMLSNIVVKEATETANRYGWEIPGLSGNIYPVIHQLIKGEITKAEAAKKAITADWRLAKRQLTWFKRNNVIHWSKTIDEAHNVIQEYLSKSA